MKAFVYINKKGQELICQGKAFKYLDAVLEAEHKEFLPKGLYSSQDMVDIKEEWCNTYSCGHFQVPKLEGVIVPNGTIKKLGIEYKGIPVEL